MKKLWNAFTTLVVVLVVLFTAALVGVRLFGLQAFAVLSGSMEPTYHTGSLIYVRKVDFRTLDVGDPITFLLDEDTVVTHRIVEVIPDPDDSSVIRYRTKGDSNTEADGGLVHCRNIIGMPVGTIPYLGYAANFVQNPPGTYIAISGCAIILILAFIPDLFDDSKKDKRKNGGKGYTAAPPPGGYRY